MTDETLVEPFAVQEYFVDGFDGHEVTDGVLKCSGYRTHRPARLGRGSLRVTVVKIVMPVANLNLAIERAQTAADQMTVQPPAQKRRVPPKLLS